MFLDVDTYYIINGVLGVPLNGGKMQEFSEEVFRIPNLEGETVRIGESDLHVQSFFLQPAEGSGRFCRAVKRDEVLVIFLEITN